MKSISIPTRNPDQLGKALKRIRENSKLTQATLATRAGLRQGTISKVESGAESSELATIYAICAALELEIVVTPKKNKKIDYKEIFLG